MRYFLVDVSRFHEGKSTRLKNYTLIGEVQVGKAFRVISAEKDHTLRATEVLRMLRDGPMLWVETLNSRYKIHVKQEIEALPSSSEDPI